MGATRTVAITIGGILRVPVKMYVATQKNGVASHFLCECGTRLKRKLVCPEDGETWQRAPQRGFEIGKGNLVPFTDEDVAAVQDELPTFKTLDVAKVVSLKEVALSYTFGQTYDLVPDTDADETTLNAYRLLVEALDEADWAMLSKLTMSTRAHRYAIVAHQNDEGVKLVAHQLGDRRPLLNTVEAVPVDAKQLDIVRRFLTQRFTDDVSFEDEPSALTVLAQRLASGKPIERQVKSGAQQAADLFNALRESVESAEAKG